jgi:GTP-binding protein Era
MAHKAGFVNIIGFPNVGKSTLINALLKERLSIITDKAQTTRHRILGIDSGEDYQIVFSDTPGYLKAGYKLQETMRKAVLDSLPDADILLIVTDLNPKERFDEELLKRINGMEVPKLLVINKIETKTEEEIESEAKLWQEDIAFQATYKIAALHKLGTDYLYMDIKDLLPDSPPYYDKESLSDRPERFFVSEIIREKILKYYSKEIPYSCEVEIESFKEAKEIIKIRGVINVSRESQKGIIIGHKGKAIKKLGTESRKGLERFFQKKVFLELFVKVNKDWRNKDAQLKKYGYIR